MRSVGRRIVTDGASSKTDVVVRSLPSLVSSIYYKYSFIMRTQNFSGMLENQLTQLPPDIRTMVLAGETAMTVGMGGEMDMDGFGIGVGAGCATTGPGWAHPRSDGCGCGRFRSAGWYGVLMGMPEYGIQVRFDLPRAMPIDGFVKTGLLNVGWIEIDKDQSWMQYVQQRQYIII